jgi:hypothetical protein
MFQRTLCTLCALLALAGALPAQAGAVYTQEDSNQDFQGKVTKTTQTISLEGNKQKTSSSEGFDTIMDYDKGVVLLINNKAKTYSEVTLKGSMYAMGASMASQMKYKAKGTKKTIAGHACDEYTLELVGETVQCFSKSAPGAAESTAAGKKMFASLGVSVPAGLPEGLMLLQEMTMQPPDASKVGFGAMLASMPKEQRDMMMKDPEIAKMMKQQEAPLKPAVQRSIVTSIKAQTVAASVFEVPAGYKKEKAPGT